MACSVETVINYILKKFSSGGALRFYQSAASKWGVIVGWCQSAFSGICTYHVSNPGWASISKSCLVLIECKWRTMSDLLLKKKSVPTLYLYCTLNRVDIIVSLFVCMSFSIHLYDCLCVIWRTLGYQTESSPLFPFPGQETGGKGVLAVTPLSGA